MANCEESPCVNVQTAICLHCLRRLCSTHILEHGKILLSEGDELCEQINELSEQLNVSLQQIHLSRQEAMNKLNQWRQKQLDKVEEKFAENIQIIEFRKDHLAEIENRLTQRLIKEAKEPLEAMQTRQTANTQSLETIRQVINSVTKDTAQLEVHSNESTTSSTGENLTNTNKSHLLQSSPSQQKFPSIPTIYYVNSNINPSELQLTTTHRPSTTQKTPITSNTIPITTINPSTSSSTTNTTAALPKVTPSQSTAKATVTTAPVVPPPQSTTNSAAAALPTASSRTIIKRPPTCSCKKLVPFFRDTTGSSDTAIENYIIRNLNQVVHVNNLMILLLSLLEAWYSQKLPPVYNHRVLFHHVNKIKKYIKSQEQQLTVIAAMQVFINNCKQDQNQSSEMMVNLLQYFYNQRCFTKEILLDWYENGVYYGYNGFQKAKIWSQSFVDRLNTDN